MSESFSCAKFVVTKIGALLGGNAADLRPGSRALLAQLRQAAVAEPGTVPAIWSVTVEGLPERGEVQRRRLEEAVHIALTQFATHQQARQVSMHDPRQPFGRAVRRLAETGGGEDPFDTPVYRRFTAVMTATTLPALLASSRGIIAQLRSAEIPFDYGRYADDLYWFLTPGSASDVRRRWGRDFQRMTAPTAETTTNTTDVEGVVQ